MLSCLWYSTIWVSLLNFPLVYNSVLPSNDLGSTNTLSSPVTQSPVPKEIITVPPSKQSKVIEPDSGDKMDTSKFVAPEEPKKAEILHIPIPTRSENQNCECGFKYPVEVMKTNDFGEETPATEFDHPWQVWIAFLITSKGKTRYEVKCGGSLINDKLILTNALCVEPFKNNPRAAEFLWERRRINVRLTNDNGRRGDEAIIKIAEVIFHPEYLAGKQEYQSALLRLESPVSFAIPEGIRPVCLPAVDEHFQMGRDGVLPKLKLEDINARNLEEKVPHNEDYNSLYSTYDCQRIYEKLDNASAKLHLCAGIKSNYTDRYFGNPLMVEMSNTQLLQVGQISSLYFKEKKIVNTTANLFMKIMELMPFIEENSLKARATWCKHAKMQFNDSAPISRIIGEAWLGVKSNRLENPACVCGYRKSIQQQGRIVGGFEAIPYDYPWQSLLEISMDDQPLQSAECGGSIINDVMKKRIVPFASSTTALLTVTTLIYKLDFAKKIIGWGWPKDKRLISVFIFDVDRNSFSQPVNPETAQMVPVTNTANVKVQILAHNTQNDEKAKIMEVAKIHIHPEYVEDFKLGYQDYDVALLELKEPLDFWNPDGPLPVCILSSSDNLDLVGKMGTVIGWGMTQIDDANSGASTLQQINVPVQPLQKCKVLSALEVTNRFICAGTFDPGHDTLHGDSGGPLMVETLHNRMLQIGVVSWGDLERRKTEGLFTDVSAALYTNVSQPEILSYIDYFSMKSEARWCKKSFFGSNPRRPWEGQRNLQKTTNPDCICGMPDEEEPSQTNPTSEFPWTVLIIKLDKPGTVSYCMGTIINNYFIMTSAQCLRNKDKVKIHLRPSIQPKLVKIQLIRFETEKVQIETSLRVSEIYIHPDFLSLEGENRFEKNIGLLKLTNPLVFTKRRKLSPVCLPSSWESSNFESHSSMVAGWKRTSVGNKKQVTLEVLDETIINTEKCGKVMRLGVNQEFICSESKNATAPVKITDGGSVTVDTKNSQLIQIGIMSHFGLMSPSGKRRYASVKHSLDFIDYFSQEERYTTWCKRA